MADTPPHPDDSGVRLGRGSTPSPPRWVKVFGIIALVLVVLVVILLLTGGSHGPGRHASAGGVGGHEPLAGGHALR